MTCDNFPTLEKAADHGGPLSWKENSELLSRESAIERGLNTFREIGAHLLAIREKRLYRAQYGSFEEYCQARWEMTGRYARRLCAAAQVTLLISDASSGAGILPATESQARPLTVLPADKVIEVWAEVVRTAPAGKVTARHVESVVAKRFGMEPLPILKPIQPKIERPFQPAILADRKDQIQLHLASAIAGVRDLVDELGTADSAASGKVLEALQRLEDFQLHLRRVDELKARRS